MKRFFLLVFLLSIGFNLSAEKKEYIGKVEPILDCVFKAGTNFPFMGELAKVPRIGQIVRPAIYSIDGEIIRPADIIIQSDLAYHAEAVIGAQNNLLGSKADLATQLENYTRYKSLNDTGTVSGRAYDIEESAYFEAKGIYEENKAELIKQEAVLSAMTQTAPYEALVADVYRPIGVIMSEHEYVRLQQLSPIYVHIKMSPEDQKKLDMQVPVTVYPMNDANPVGIVHGKGIKTQDGGKLVIYNHSKYLRSVKINGKELPLVREVDSVLPFDLVRQTGISVPKDSIYKDKKGYYVWKAAGVRNCTPGVGLQKVFPVNKIYVEPGNETKNFASYLIYKSLKPSKKISVFDMVVRNPPQGLKDGDMVCYMKNDYIFMPGDEVKVVIGD